MSLWAALPRVVRAPLVPLGALFGRHTTTATAVAGAGTVAGVLDLQRDGFEPVENYTGAFWVAALWPEQHRRSVAETRSWWLEDSYADGRLWLIRSPWPALDVREAFNVIWRWVERDGEPVNDDICRKRVSEALSWSESRAVAWHRESTHE